MGQCVGEEGDAFNGDGFPGWIAQMIKAYIGQSLAALLAGDFGDTKARNGQNVCLRCRNATIFFSVKRTHEGLGQRFGIAFSAWAREIDADKTA